MRQTIISLKKINKRFGKKTVLNDLDVEIGRGEFVSIVGPSGSGKSTLINILGLLDCRYEGAYEFDGNEMQNRNENELSKLRNRKIGYVFQAYNLIEQMSTLDNILLPASYCQSKVDYSKIEKICNDLGIAELLHQEVGTLSGGEKQRVSIARAMINQPTLIIADEPTGNLDEKNANQVYEILREVNNRGTTIVMVTHSRELAEKADRCLFLSQGNLSEVKL